MKFEEFQVTTCQGDVVTGKIAVPENLTELLKVHPEDNIFKRGLYEYMAAAKRRLASTRSRKLKIRVNDLTPEQIIALRRLGLLK